MQEGRLRAIAYGIAAVGLLISIYLVLVTYSAAPLVCPDKGIINCENVLTSQYSRILGVPNVILGIVFFVAEIAAIRLYFGKDPLIVYNAMGMAFVAYYIFAEYMVKSICIFCTGVHVCVLSLLIISILGYRKQPTSS